MYVAYIKLLVIHLFITILLNIQQVMAKCATSYSWRSTLTPEDKTVTNKSAIFTVFGNSFKELRHFEQSLLSVNVEIVKFPKLICK